MDTLAKNKNKNKKHIHTQKTTFVTLTFIPKDIVNKEKQHVLEYIMLFFLLLTSYTKHVMHILHISRHIYHIQNLIKADVDNGV